VWAKADLPGPKFEISFPMSVHPQPITGRLLLVISGRNEPEVRFQVGWPSSSPVFGADVYQLKPGESAVVDGAILGYPFRALGEIPSGDYYVQAILNVYTEFHRADAHVIWAHMDQWEGQQFNQSPGNLYSRVQKLHLDPSRNYAIKLSLTEVIPPVQVPADTKWVKRFKIKSQLLTKFWGHTIYLGAIALLPRDYSSHPGVHYPVVYLPDHFPHDAPFDFRTEDVPGDEKRRQLLKKLGYETGYEFYQAWSAEHFPRMIAVYLQHPTPYSYASYAVNSANNGPYGDAIMTELIPYIEEHLRIIRRPYARVLTGGSTAGWETLALQLYHPKFFGGTWTFCPDPIDFRSYGLVNIYEDDNAFVFQPPPQDAENLRPESSAPERFLNRADDGQPLTTMRQVSQLESVVAGGSGSGLVLGTWEAVYGPVGADGYPKPLWDKLTGKIDHDVARYMRDHGYDLRYYAATNWPKIGPDLVGKLHLYTGDMDDFYLNLGVYHFEDFLKKTKNPYYGGSFVYGRPMKGHGWTPMTNAELVKVMAAQIAKNAPEGSSAAWQDD